MITSLAESHRTRQSPGTCALPRFFSDEIAPAKTVADVMSPSP